MLPAALSASRATSQGYRSGCIRPNPLSTGSQSRLRPRRLPDHAGRMPSAPVDYTRTSARPVFAALPEPVRAEIARFAGAPVQAADPPVGSGFTGSYAGVLHLTNGRRVFAKAGGPGMPHVITGLCREAEVVPLLAGLRCVPSEPSPAGNGTGRTAYVGRRRKSSPNLRRSPVGPARPCAEMRSATTMSGPTTC